MPQESPVNGDVSFWYAQMGGIPAARPPLPGDLEVDVCVVGGGFTGLWTAYYLKRAAPDLRVAVLEQEFCGFGASGRNGGWLTASLAGSRRRYAATDGRQAVLEPERQMQASVDEVVQVAQAERIDADIVKDGSLTVARTPAQRQRLEAAAREDNGWGDPRPFLGDARTCGMYSFGDLLTSGATLAMGSDWSVSTPDPLAQIEVAVRRLPCGQEGEPFGVDQRLSLPDALSVFTAGSAYVNHDDDAGTLAVGRRADLAVVDRNLFAWKDAGVSEAVVELTVAGGRVVHG